MTWGFPLVLKGKNGQPLKPKPVNNARTDKLFASAGSARPVGLRYCALVRLLKFIPSREGVNLSLSGVAKPLGSSRAALEGVWRRADRAIDRMSALGGRRT